MEKFIPINGSLEEAKQFLRDNLTDGANCPCCTQFAKQYKRKIYSTMALTLINLFHKKTDISGEYIHISKIVVGKGGSGDFGKLALWGMIQEKQNEDDASKKESGLWRITDKGMRFVNNQIKVPKYVSIYNNKPYGFSKDEISILDALGDKFNYSELMQSE